MPAPSLRQLLSAAVVLSLAATAGCVDRSSVSAPGPTVSAPTGSGSTAAPTSASPSASPTPSPKPAPQLPRGGRTLFPAYRVIAYYGTAGTSALGVLGEGSPDVAAGRLERAAAPFAKAGGKPVQPAFELIVTVADRTAGSDGDYSSELDDASIQRYLDAARRHKLLLLLDLQPGRASFLAQARRYERFLRQPDVGLALDPEWKLTATQRPSRQIGSTDAASINEVSAYLASLVAQGNLPEKLFVIHQFRESMVKGKASVVDRPGLATMFHIDGFGGQGVKREVYDYLASKDPRFANGFKLFYDEDTDLMTPVEAMALRPRPDLISYQ